MNTRKILYSLLLLGVVITAVAHQHPIRKSGDARFHENFLFIDVEPGEFVMGSPTEEKGRQNDEVPHPVRITRRFQIGETEVTQGMWRKVMGDLPKDVLKRDDNLPITYVSWENVQEFVGRLRKLRQGDGYFYRLPTEAEWEYAARGGSRVSLTDQRKTFPFGNTADRLDDYAWSWSNAKGFAQPVKTRKPNPLGVYDMHGNVWEWTEDRYASDPSRVPVHPAFGHPVNLTEIDPKNRRIIRGGCSTRSPVDLRSATRGRLPAGVPYSNLGVRLVRVEQK